MTVSNPTSEPLTASLLLTLPLGAQPETDRASAPSRTLPGPTTAPACKAGCDTDGTCRGWRFEEATATCGFYDGGVPQNVYATGVTTGIKGVWTSVDASTLVHSRAAPPSPGPPTPNSTAACLAVTPDVGVDIDRGTEDGRTRPVAEGPPGLAECRSTCCSDPSCSAWVVADGTAPPAAAPAPCVPGKPCCWHKSGTITERPPCKYCTSAVSKRGGGNVAGLDEQVGNFALHVPAGDDVTATMYTAANVSAIFADFASGMPSAVSPLPTHGGAAATTTVPPGQNKTVTVIFGWRFENRFMSEQPIGNFYASLHPDAATAAVSFGSKLAETVTTINGVHAAFFDATSVPAWLQDTLVNSMSQWRSAFMTADGRWRQWEAYDCVDLDSVHNDYQRHVPYALFFPELVKNTMETGWAKLQQPDGMITESLSGGCMGPTGKLDGGGGRVMGDVSTVFVIETLELFEFTGDDEWLDRLYPTVIKSLDWIIDVGTGGSALPKKQCCTYDIIDFAKYDHTTFNSMMFLAAMRACKRLAKHKGDSATGAKCTAAFNAASVALDAGLWNSTSEYYRAWTDSALGSPPWVMADTLYGQVVANYLNLKDVDNASSTPWLVDPAKVASHLKTEAAFNPSPYGLTVVTTTGSPPVERPGDTPAFASADRASSAPGCGTQVTQAKYDSVWMGGAPDWAALQIALEAQGAGLEAALAMAEKELDHYRSTLRDQWNIHGLTANDGYGLDGLPWCTAHYGFHMPLWFIPLAMTKTSYSIGGGPRTLSFDPAVKCPYTLPMLVTGAVGLLTCQPGGGGEQYTVAVTAGNLTVASISVGTTNHPFGHDTTLLPGQSVTFST